MENSDALRLTESLMILYKNFSGKRFRKLKEHKFNSIYREWDLSCWYGFRNLFFNLITGEPSFDKFYDRFGTPASNKITPIAWESRFLPDLINDAMWDDSLTLHQKVETIKLLYFKCKTIEEEFQKKNNPKPKPKSKKNK
jgi:hypothetical protein